MKKQTLFGVTAVVLIVGFVLASSWYRGREVERVEAAAEEAGDAFAPAHSMSFGPEDARVTVVEFFDPACESCARLHAPVKEILARHPDQVRLVLRYAPLHVGSEGVCQMLEAARQQGRYTEVLEVMFATQRGWASHHNPQPDLLWRFIPAAGVDVDLERMREDAGGFAISSRVQQDIDEGRALGVRKTPSFFVNGRPLTSFGLPQLEALIAEEVAANY